MIKNLFTVMAIPLSIFIAGTFRSVEFACVLLLFLSLLKFVEVKETKDYQNFILIYILFFCSSVMLATQIIFYILSFLFVLPHFIYLLKQQGVEFRNINIFKMVKLLSVSVVVLAFFYLIIPQVGVGGFGKVSKFNETISGISSELSPGSLFEISKDTSIHLALDINNVKNLIPGPYWRIYTFIDNDGKNWNKNSAIETEFLPDVPSTIIVNDLTKSSHPKIKGAKFSYKREPPNFLEQFKKIRSYVLYPSRRVDSKLSNEEIELNLKVANISKEFRNYFKDIKSGSNSKKFTMVINKLSKLNLSYSTSKTVVESADMSSFLFDLKAGYCEHFASATALALRLVGVPARVVVGYFGGKYNDRTKMIFLTGENSHAWIEYYDGEKWVEADPVELLVSSAFLPDNDLVLFTQNTIDEQYSVSKLVSDLYIAYMTLNFNFFKYDLEYQKMLAKNFYFYLSQNFSSVVFYSLLIAFLILFISFSFQSDSKFFKKTLKYLGQSEVFRIESILAVDHKYSEIFYNLFLRSRFGRRLSFFDRFVVLIKLQYIKLILRAYYILKSIEKSARRFR